MNDHNAPLIKQLMGMGELKPLVEAALKLKKANTALQSILQEPFVGQVSIGKVEQGCITLDVPHASMLTILRYQTPDILRQLRQFQGLAGIASIKCRVKPPLTSDPVPQDPVIAPKVGPTPLSEAARKMLKNTAERIDDPALQAILMQLSKR